MIISKEHFKRGYLVLIQQLHSVMNKNSNPNKETRKQQNVLFLIIIIAAVITITVGIIGLGYMQSLETDRFGIRLLFL